MRMTNRFGAALSALSILTFSLFAPLMSAGSAWATPLYWDTNGTTAGSGAATGTWGTSNFWNTDSTGGSGGAFQTSTASTDDLTFSAGTNGTTGTITVSGAQVANSITLSDNVVLTVSGGTSITLSNGGSITNSAGVTANHTINSPLILGNGSTANFTFTNNNASEYVGSVSRALALSTGNITVASGAGARTLTFGGTGNISLTENLIDAGGGGSVSLHKVGYGALQLGNSGTTMNYSGGTYLDAGVLAIVGNAGNLKTGTTFYIAANTSLTSINQSGGNYSGILQQWNGDFTFNDPAKSIAASQQMTFNGGTVNLGATGTDVTRTVSPLTSTTTFTQNGVISNGTNGFTNGLTKTGVGTMVLSGANTYTGATGVTGGVLIISNASTFSNTSAINLSGVGRLDVNVTNQSLAKLASPTGTGVVAGTFLRYSQAQTTAGAGNGPGTIFGTVELNVTNVNPNYTLDFGSGSTLASLAAATYNSPITLSGDASIDATTASLTGGTSMTVGASTSGSKTLTLTGTSTGSIAGIISNASGTVGVTKTGAGTWTLSGANTYTGATTIGGTTSGGTLIADTATNATVLSSSSGLAFTGAGGTFQLKGLSGQARSQILNGLTLSAGAAIVDANNVAGGTSTTIDLTGTGGALTITRSAGATVDFKASTGTFGTTAIIKTAQANDASGILGGWATASGADWAVNNGSNVVAAYTGYTTMVAGATSDSLNDSTGTLTLTGAHTHNSLKVTTGATLGLGANLLTLTGGGLLSTGTTASTISGTAGATRLTAGNGSGNYELLIQQFNTGGLTISGVIGNSGANAVSLTKSGTGALTLSGINTYSGGTTLNSGTLILSTSGAALGSGTLTINGGNINTATTAFVLNNIPMIWNADVNYTAGLSSGLNLGTGAVTLNNFVKLNNTTGLGFVVGGIISGTGGLNITGRTTLTGNNTYTGNTIITGGTNVSLANLALQNSAIDTSGNSSPTFSGTTPTIGGFLGANNFAVTAAVTSLTLNLGTGANQTYSGALSGGNTMAVVKQGLGAQALYGFNTYTGATTITSGILAINTIQDAGSLLSNSLGLPAVGSNSIIGLANTGTLQFTGSNGSAGSSNRVVNLSTAAGGTFTLDASGSTAFNLSGGITTSGTGATTSTLALTGTGAGSQSGTIVNGASGNVTALTKSGAGTWTLGGANSYTGATAVNNGKLLINGNQSAATGTVTVNSGGTLGGSGTVGGATSILSGGTLAPGNSPGTINFGAGLTIAAGGIFNWENDTVNTLGAAGTNWDVANVTAGTTSISNTPTTGAKLNLLFTNASTNFSNSFWNTNRTWDFITGGVAGTNVFDTTNIAIFINGVQQGSNNTITGEGTFSTIVSGSNERLVWTFIPPPNNSQILITASPDTITSSGPGSSGTATTHAFGRVLVGSTQTVSGLTITNSGTDSAPYTVTSGGDVASTTFASGTLATGSTSGTITLSTASTGSKSGTVTVDNTSADSFGTGLGSDDANDVFSVTGTAVNQRSFSVGTSPIALGRFLVGVTPSGTTAISSSGLNAVTANATLGSFSGTNTDSLTLTTGDSTTFNGGVATQTANYTIGGSVGTAGALTSASFSSPVTAELGSISNVLVSVTGTAVNQRSFSVGTPTIALGTIHAGTATAGSTAISSSGLNAVTANASLGSFVGTNTNGLTLTTDDSTTFNGASASQTANYSIGGSVTAGVLSSASFSSSVTAELGSIANVVVNVTGSVFNGNGKWTSAANGNWGANANWTDSNGVNAAPGTFAGFDDVDTATFDGSGAGTIVSLNGTSPSVKNIALSGGIGYTVAPGSGGTLILKADSGSATITSSSTVTHTISAPVELDSDTIISVTNAAGLVAIGGDISQSGAHSLTKNGAGTLNLTGTNSYTGPTNVNGGKLLINGDQTLATGTLTIADGATLGGTGTIGGDTVISGTHSPGNSPGIQTFLEDLTYLADPDAPQVVWELVDNTATNAPNPNANFDSILVGGNLNFADTTALNLVFDIGASLVDWTDSFWATSHLATNGWLLYDVAGTSSGVGNLDLTVIDWLDSNAATLSSVRSGSTFTLYQQGQDIYLNYTAENVTVVPEPGTLALAAIGLLALGLVGWRKRRSR